MSIDKIIIEEFEIDNLRFIIIDGKILRSKPLLYAQNIADEIEKNSLFIVRNYIKSNEVDELISKAIKLSNNCPAKWIPYTEGCNDFHHYDFDSQEDDNRRIKEMASI